MLFCEFQVHPSKPLPKAILGDLGLPRKKTFDGLKETRYSPMADEIRGAKNDRLQKGC